MVSYKALNTIRKVVVILSMLFVVNAANDRSSVMMTYPLGKV